MKLTISDESLYKEGVRKDKSGHYIFDNGMDFDDDIIFLNKDLGGQRETNNLTYYYGFVFNPKVSLQDQKEFRDALKHSFNDPDVFYSNEAMEFVRDGVYRLAKMKNLNDFGVAISTADHYCEETLTGLMCTLVWDEIPDSTSAFNMRLLKKFVNEVTFDEHRAKEALMQTNKYRNVEDAEDAVRALKGQFENAIKKGGLFKMKHYQPVAGRVGFMDFLKFRNSYDQMIYEKLKKGTEVLICDDFLTSGATVNEVIRFLNTVNPNTKISVFVLIDQRRSY